MTYVADESLSDELKKLLRRREKLRKQKQYTRADKVRQELVRHGYQIIDTPQGQKLEKFISEKPIQGRRGPGKIAVFGSGEMSPTGRRIHEYLIKNIPPPVNVALLET